MNEQLKQFLVDVPVEDQLHAVQEDNARLTQALLEIELGAVSPKDIATRALNARSHLYDCIVMNTPIASGKN